MKQNLSESFHPYAAVTILFWSLAYVLTRMTQPYFSPFSLGFLRYLTASAALAVTAAVQGLPRPRARDLPWFVLSGGVGFFLYMITFNQGQYLVSAATSSVVIASVPVLTAVASRFLYGERLSALRWCAVAVELLGVVTLTLLDGALTMNAGLLWLIAAALCLSGYNLIQRKLTRRYTALQSSAYSIFAGTLALSVFAPGAFRELSAAPAAQWLCLGVLGVFSSALAYVSWSKAFSLAKQTSLVSNYMFFTPFLTSLLAFLFLREVPDRATLLGGGLILLGAFLFNFGERIFSRGRA